MRYRCEILNHGIDGYEVWLHGRNQGRSGVNLPNMNWQNPNPNTDVYRTLCRLAQAIRFSVANFDIKNVFFKIPKYLEPDMETA